MNDLIAKTHMRPADILVYLFGSHGQDMAIDVSVVDPSSKSCWKKPLAAGEQRERSKRHKYAEDLTKQGILFNQLVFEAFGGIPRDSYEYVLEPAAKRIKDYEPENWAAPTAKAYWLQRFSITLWRFNVSPFADRMANVDY